MDTMNFKKYIILLLFVSLKSVVYAQPDYQTQMDIIFNIPAHKVTTGVLINRSPDIIDMQNFKLQSDANPTAINMRNWLELFYRLYASHLNMNGFSYDVMLAHKYPDQTADGQIPLGLIYYRYDKIKSHAVQNGLLSVDTLNQKITDISPAGQTPLETDTCFAASALMDTITVGTHTFILKDSLFVSNKKTDVQEIYTDFGNGQGYLRVYPNQPIAISYNTLGNKTIKTKIVVASKSYYASSQLYVKNAPFQPLSAATSGIPIPDFGPEPYTYISGNIEIKSYYGIWYRCNHDNTIRKPILIVSGFDPEDNNRIGSEKEGEKEEKIHIYNVFNKNRFLDGLREMGYDIIIYRSASSTQSIIPNALSLVYFITTKINAAKTSDNELIVIGSSMGGLMCRYALTWMEYMGVDHKTKLFITMDSPHNGANIPLGIQFMLHYLNQNFLESISKIKDATDDMLNSTSAKEMLIYHHSNTTGGTARCHSNRDGFLNDLAARGNFPKKCRTMAVSLGSGNGTNQGFPAGAPLLIKPASPIVTGAYLTLDVILMMVGIPPTIGVTLAHTSWEFEVNAVPNQTSKSIYKETISLDVCIPRTKVYFKWWWAAAGIPPVIVPYLDCSPNLLNRNIVVNNTQPLDNAPGSIMGLHNLSIVIQGNLIPTLLNILGVVWTDPFYDCFIPAYSALGLNVAPHTNIKSYLNTAPGVTKINDNFYFNTNKSVSLFDYLYIENANLYHVSAPNKEGVFSADMLAAMDESIATSQLTLGDKTISSGQSVAYEAENITVNGNFIVQSGGSLDMRGNEIVLKPGFHAKAGSSAVIKADNSWICPAGSIQSVSFSPLSKLAWEEVSESQTQIRVQTQTSEEQLTHAIEQEEMENEIRFFPNPVENILNLHILNRVEGEIKITVIDIKGQTIYSQLITNSVNNTIDFSRFVSGVYIVIIASKDSVRSFKIIKQ